MLLDELRLQTISASALDQARRRFPRAQRIRGKFLPPLPWAWIAPALLLPGAAPRVAALLAWYATVRRQFTNVRIPAAALRELRVSRSAYYRALVQLEGAGLITVTRAPGRMARITLALQHPDKETTNGRAPRPAGRSATHA